MYNICVCIYIYICMRILSYVFVYLGPRGAHRPLRRGADPPAPRPGPPQLPVPGQFHDFIKLYIYMIRHLEL